MRVFLAFFCLFFGSLGKAQKVFIKTELTKTGWTPVTNRSFTSLFSCSLACKNAFPQCKAFAFDATEGCRHGLLKSEPDLGSQTVFIERKELEMLKIWRQSGTHWNTFVFAKSYLIGKKLFVAVPIKSDYRKSPEICQKFKGKLATSIREQSVWQYFAKNVYGYNYWWVGLTSLTNSSCSNEGCNNNWMWDDGEVYKHEILRTCSAQIRTIASRMIIGRPKVTCPGQMALSDDLREIPLWKSDVQEVELWPLCEFDV